MDISFGKIGGGEVYRKPLNVGTLPFGWLLLILLFAMWGVARADEQQRGPAFTDHSYVEAMPTVWQKKPIRYNKLPEGVDLAISLDQHLYPALLPLIKRYGKEHQLKIALEEGTCGISSGALLDKSVDMGGFCCPAGETDRLPGLSYHTLGIASLALLVHPDNPVSDVSFKQAQQMYSGIIGNWEQLAPSFSHRIVTIARLHCKNRPGHWRLLLDNEDLFSPTVREVSTIPDMIDLTAHQAASLGYETLYMANRHAGSDGVKVLSIDGVAPQDNDALATGRYPLYRTYNITTWVTPGLSKPAADQLVAYLYEHFDEIDPVYGLISTRKLRQEGWRFEGDELVGSPRN